LCARVKAREKAREKAGSPRFQGAHRYARVTDQQCGNQFGNQCGNGATLDGVDHRFLVLCKSGRVAVRWARPMAGTPKTVTISREAAGW
jgi:putative transposase